MSKIDSRRENFKEKIGGDIRKYIVVGVALMFAIIVLFSYVSYRNRIRNLEEIDYISEELSRITQEHVADIFSDHLSAINVTAVLYGTSLNNPSVDMDLLKELEKNTSFDYIRFIDLEGTDYASDGAIANCYDREYFQRGINGESGMCEVLESRINGQKLVGFYSPVLFEGDICGIMVGFLQEENISSVLHSEMFNYNAYTYLVREDGVVVGQYPIVNGKTVDDITKVLSYVMRDEGNSVEEAFRTRENISFAARGYHGYETIGHVVPVENTDWTIIQLFPDEVAFQMIEDSQKDSRKALIVACVLFGLSVFYFGLSYRKSSRAYTASVITQEREKNQLEMMLIVAAARTVYQFILQENLTKNNVRIVYNETGIGTKEDEGRTVDEMITDVLQSIPDDNHKHSLEQNFSRDALLEAYGSGKRVISSRVQQIYNTGLHWIEITAILNSGDDGDIYCVAMTRIVDEEIAQRRALEKAKEEAIAANRSKSQFLANMSHEIRTPINAILGMNTMVIRETNQTDVKDYALDVEEAGNTLLSLINDILDFSKIESGNMDLVPAEYDFAVLINDIINMVKPKVDAKGLELRIHIDPNIPAIMVGDEMRIKQIILNILNNAVKYTPSGSVEIVIDSKPFDDNIVELSVSVKDTGIGIKEENLNKIFEPYKRIEEHNIKTIEGTGLGMAITKSLLARMGSGIHVESIYGEGSTFSFVIKQPYTTDEIVGQIDKRINKLKSDYTEKQETFHAPDVRILAVDDVEMNLVVVKSLLKRVGCIVDTCQSGFDAIELAQKIEYDIIFLDAMMPNMNGVQTLHAIKSDCIPNINTPIVVMTANAIVGAREEYLRNGFDDYISKPVSSEKLESIIRKLISDDKIIPISEVEEKNVSKMDISDSSNGETDKLYIGLKNIPIIDAYAGLNAAGSKEAYIAVVKLFYDTANNRMEMINDYYENSDIENYTIQVHALKSSARLIGASELAEEALELEMAGKNGNIELINGKTYKLLYDYERIVASLDKIINRVDDKKMLEKTELNQMLMEMLEVLEAYDYDTSQMILDSMSEYKMPDDFEAEFRKLKSKIAEVDGNGAIEVIRQYMVTDYIVGSVE